MMMKKEEKIFLLDKNYLMVLGLCHKQFLEM